MHGGAGGVSETGRQARGGSFGVYAMIETETKERSSSSDSRNGNGERDERGLSGGGSRRGRRGKGGGGHEKGVHDDLNRASKRSLIASLVLVSVYAVVAFAGGALSGSLALKADAGHMLADLSAIVLALVAMRFSEREASAERTFGNYRAEALAALLNALALWLIAAWIFFEGYQRIWNPIEIQGSAALIVGAVGLAVNLAVAAILHGSAGHNMNAQSALQHVIADLLGSIGVIVSAILVMAFGLTIFDPIVSMGIAVLILVGAWRLLAQVFHVLMEGTPKHIDVYRLCSDLEDMDGVTLIHDVHIWTVTPGNEAFTAHALIDPSYDGDGEALLKRMHAFAHEEYGIGHVTIQMERSLDGCTENHHVGHLTSRTVNRG